MSTPTIESQAGTGQLKSGVIGLVGAATLGMVFLSPAMTMYGLFGPIFLAVGKFAPLSFVFALLATLPTAFSYAMLSRDFPSSGSTADWATRAGGLRVGAGVGWLVFFYYLTNFVIQVAAIGLFFNELLLACGVVVPGGYGYVIGVLLGCAWPAWMVYRGLSISVKGALAFLLSEIVVVLALCGTILVVAPGRGMPVTGEGFNVGAALGNPSAMFGALIFAMLGFTGFDVVSTLAEETRTPKKLIPQATILAVLLYAVIMIGGMWALSTVGDAVALQAAADENRMPINDVARNFWGRGSILVTLTALTATLGLIIATSVGASRVLFSKGRRLAAPAVFGTLHAKYQVPWAALHLIFGAGMFGALALFAVMGGYKAYVWWCTTSTFFAMLTFLFSNLAMILLNRKKMVTSPGGFACYFVVPALGIVADVYILVQAFFIEAWKGSWEMGKSVVVFDVALAGLAVVLALVVGGGMKQRAGDGADEINAV